MPEKIPFIKQLANNYQFSGHAIRYVVTEVKKNTMLERKNGEEKVHLIINGENYWIRDGKDFENLRVAQPIIIKWEDVKVVSELSVPWDGEKIIGSQPNKNTILQAITALFKTLFGKK